MKFNPLHIFRLLSKNRQEPFLSFSHILGFNPGNIELYEIAVRHRSVPFKNKNGEAVNNERLEFLGDAVLNSIISDILYHRYGNKQEGFLTNARSNIVKRDSLNKMCHQTGLDKLVVADKQLNLKENANIFGNALEAFIGAIYLDAGYDKCARFVKQRLLISPETMQILVEDNENFKSALLEWCQQRYLTLDFDLVEETVDSHNRHTFTSQVLINNMPICTGSGANKKESHQRASAQALRMIRNDENFTNTFGLTE